MEPNSPETPRRDIGTMDETGVPQASPTTAFEHPELEKYIQHVEHAASKVINKPNTQKTFHARFRALFALDSKTVARVLLLSDILLETGINVTNLLITLFFYKHYSTEVVMELVFNLSAPILREIVKETTVTLYEFLPSWAIQWEYINDIDTDIIDRSRKIPCMVGLLVCKTKANFESNTDEFSLVLGKKDSSVLHFQLAVSSVPPYRLVHVEKSGFKGTGKELAIARRGLVPLLQEQSLSCFATSAYQGESCFITPLTYPQSKSDARFNTWVTTHQTHLQRFVARCRMVFGCLDCKWRHTDDFLVTTAIVCLALTQMDVDINPFN